MPLAAARSGPAGQAGSGQVITDPGSVLAHVLEVDQLVDELLDGAVGQRAAVLAEVVGDGLRELLARRGLAGERVQLLDDWRELFVVLARGWRGSRLGRGRRSGVRNGLGHGCGPTLLRRHL